MRLTIKFKHSGEWVASGTTETTAQEFEGNWYFAPEAVRLEYLQVAERTYTCPYKGTCFWVDLKTPTVHLRNFAWVYRTPKPGYEFIKDQLGFYVRTTEATEAVESAEAAV